ncbi:MAG: YhgE/Pip domain-containing protein [Coriobacteriales bacterium]|nr:YhgE/Pip domain-containing protein [Coriobacteriales bacterium]
MTNPFLGIKFASLEMQNFRAGKMMLLAVAFIALIPLIYGGMFLLAFLDPYNNLVNVPAAVVCEDQGAIIDGEQQNLGQELCDSLIENNNTRIEGQASGYDWKFVDRKTADAGLQDATYYMELIIPKDFSKNITTADSDNPKKSELQVFFNPSTNLIATTVGQSMVTKIRAELDTKISEQYFDNVFLKISDAADGLQDAVDGANAISVGASSAKEGSGALSSGLNDAYLGSQTITYNLGSLQKGAEKIASGVGLLGSSLGQLKSGIDEAQQSSSSLATALGGIANCLQAYAETGDNAYLIQAKNLANAVKLAQPEIGNDLFTYIDELISNLNLYAQKAIAVNNAQATMDDKENAMSIAATALTASAWSVQTPLSDLGTYASNTNTNLSNYNINPTDANLATLLGGIPYLLTAAGTLCSATDPSSVVSLLNNLNIFTGTLSEYKNAAGDYSTAALEMANAGAQASKSQGLCIGYLTGLANMSTVTSGSVTTISDAVSKLYDATSSDLLSGATQLSDGAKQLEEGSASLTDGLDSAASGSVQLDEGLGALDEGSSELASGITDGQQTMKDSVKNSASMSQMMSDPVSANGENQTGETITNVKNYGTGFAPYFIGLSLWVGALMISFLISSLNRRILMSKSSAVTAVVASYIPMLIINAIQALFLLLFVQFILKMEVKYVLAFYLFALLTCMCFTAIVQFFRASLGTVGMVVVVILLMLQLCTAAGTFPIETELPIFNWLNPFLPMTYVVQGFRMSMCGLSLDYIWFSVSILVLFTVVFFVLSTIVALRNKKVKMITLYPPIKLVT